MNQIKFRIRNLITNQIIGHEVISPQETYHTLVTDEKVNRETGEVSCPAVSGLLQLKPDSHLQRELFTGFKHDFSGGPHVELYEFDLLQSRTGTVREIRWCDKLNNWIVGFYSIIGFSVDMSLGTALIAFEMSYAGNVIENPDLMGIEVKEAV